MSAAEPSAKDMFGDEDAAPDDNPDEDEGAETDEDLRTLGDAALAAFHTGDGLAFAKAIRDLSGDKEE